MTHGNWNIKFNTQSSFTLNTLHLHYQYRDAGTVYTDNSCCANRKIFLYHCERKCRAFRCSSDVKEANAVMSIVPWFAFTTIYVSLHIPISINFCCYIYGLNSVCFVCVCFLCVLFMFLYYSWCCAVSGI